MEMTPSAHKWLPKLCTMELLASYCLTEPGSGSDAAALRTRAVRDGDHYVLTGQKQFISGAGPGRSLWLVMVRTGGDARRHLHARSRGATRPAFRSGGQRTQDGLERRRPTRAVILRNARVPV